MRYARSVRRCFEINYTSIVRDFGFSHVQTYDARKSLGPRSEITARIPSLYTTPYIGRINI